MKSNQYVSTFNGLNILRGENTYPGSGIPEDHADEIRLFYTALEPIKSDKPIMVEIGCFWALWSLLFRQKYLSGKNILIELGKRHLEVGKTNFELNGWDYKAYHGGFRIDNSGTFKNRALDLEYDKKDGEQIVGPELNFNQILQENDISFIDMLHLDIQGSEQLFLSDIDDILRRRYIKNIIVATHSEGIHNSIKEMLNQYGFRLKSDFPFGSLGGDGYINGTLE